MAVSRIEITTAFEGCAEDCKSFILHEELFKEADTGAVYMVLRGCKNTDLCTRIAEKLREENGTKQEEQD